MYKNRHLLLILMLVCPMRGLYYNTLLARSATRIIVSFNMNAMTIMKILRNSVTYGSIRQISHGSQDQYNYDSSHD